MLLFDIIWVQKKFLEEAGEDMEQQSGNKALIDHLRRSIVESPDQRITFYDFMNECLYHPLYGYYSQEKMKIGKQGDFYTSSSIGTLMGECLAHAAIDHLCSITDFDNKFTKVRVVEWGGGNGRLAKHMLDEILISYPSWYTRVEWIAIEKSGYHLNQQEIELADHIHKYKKISTEEWMKEQTDADDASEECYHIVIANELLDAFPVHRLKQADGKCLEQMIAWDKVQSSFVSRWEMPGDHELSDELERQQIMLIDGQQAEVNTDAAKWVKQLADKLERGYLFVIDYGDVKEEIYAKHRMEGTLVCYRNHQAHDNPLIHVGEQDITAHVNFSNVIQAAIEAGFVDVQMRTQKQFLVESGILEQLQNHQITDPFHPIAKRNRAIRQLLLSDQMSELFKVVTAAR